jgi:hypothetical protein
MYYAIAEGTPASTGKPYHVLKFSTLRDMKFCPLITKTTLVYSNVAELEQFCSQGELKAIWRTMNLTTEMPNKIAAKTLHDFVLTKATTWKEEDEPMVELVVDKVEVVTETPVAKKVSVAKSDAPAAERIKDTDIINPTKPYDPEWYNKGSLRDTHVSRIMKKQSVADCVAELAKIGSNRAKVLEFVKFARKEGHITIKGA